MSQLEVISPVEAIWDEGLEEFIYPFIFTSDSDWELDVCAQVPEGYAVAGIYDENGNLISTANCTQAFVAGETKVIAFQVIKTGSPEQFAVNAVIRAESPEGLVNNVNISVPSRLTPSALLPGWIVILIVIVLGGAVIYLVKRKKTAKHVL